MGPEPASGPDITDTLSSPSPAPRPSTHTQPLTTNDVDIGLAAALQSNVATGASLLPALNITNGPSTRSKSVGRTRAREPTTSPQAMTQGGEERVQTVPKPATKKRRVDTQAEPVAGPSKKAMGKQRQPDPPLPPPTAAKGQSPIQKFTSAIRSKIPSITIRGPRKNKSRISALDLYDPTGPTPTGPTTAAAIGHRTSLSTMGPPTLHPPTSAHRMRSTPSLVNAPTISAHKGHQIQPRPSSKTPTAPNPAEEDEMVTLKKSDLQRMLQSAMEEFMQKQQGGPKEHSLEPATPQGTAQGWSDDEGDEQYERGGLRFAQSSQTTPGKLTSSQHLSLYLLHDLLFVLLLTSSLVPSHIPSLVTSLLYYLSHHLSISPVQSLPLSLAYLHALSLVHLSRSLDHNIYHQPSLTISCNLARTTQSDSVDRRSPHPSP
jgi:hypothetical protein